MIIKCKGIITKLFFSILLLTMANTANALELSGTISLPGVNTAAGDLGVGVQVTVFDSGGTAVADSFGVVNEVIADGGTEVAYTVTYGEAPSGGTYQVAVFCINNCGNYVFASYTQYLQDDGSLSIALNQFNASNIPAQANIELIEQPVISGSVSLPGGALADADIVISVFFEAYDANDNYVGGTGTNVTILDGQPSGILSLPALPVPSGGSYALYSRCFTGCGDFLTNFYYMQDDLSFAESFNQVESSTLPTQVDIVLVQGIRITGTLSLPNSAMAVGDITNYVSYQTFDANNEGTFSPDESVTIFDNQSEASFSILATEVPTGGVFQLSTRCTANCGDYVAEAQYRQDDGSDSFVYNVIESEVLPSSIAFSLVEGTRVSGSVSLPGGQIAAGDIENRLIYQSNNPNNSLVEILINDYVTISDNESEVAFSVVLPDLPVGRMYSISSVCNDNCGDYVTGFQYLQDDGSTSFNYNEIQLSQLPAQVDFTLLEGQKLTGTVNLPTGFMAPNDIDVSIQLREFDGNGGSSSTTADITILQGETSEDFSINFIPDPNKTYQVEYGCQTFNANDCGTLLGTTVLTPLGLRYVDFFNATDLRFSAAELPANVELILIEGTEISGTVNLPEASTSPDDVLINVSVQISDPQTFAISSAGSDVVTISQGSSSGTYSFVYPPLTGTQKYRLFSDCGLNCGGIIETIYLQSDGTKDNQSDDLSSLPATTDFDFVENELISVTVSLPAGVSPTSDLVISISQSLSSGPQGFPFLDTAFASVTIAQGSTSATVDIPKLEADSSYTQFRFGCNEFENADCFGLLDEIFYTPSGQQFSFDGSYFLTSELPDTIQLELAAGVEYLGQVQLPGAALSSSVNVSISVDILDSENNYITGKFLFETIQAGQTSAPFSFILPPQDSEAVIRIRYGCSQQDCGSILSTNYFTPSGPVYSISQGQFALDSLPNNIVLVLFEGTQLSGVVQLPSPQLASADFTVDLYLSGYDAEENFGTSEFSSVTIPSGQSSVAYSLLIPPSTEGFYSVSVNCSIGQSIPCDNFIRFAYQTPDELVFDFQESLFPIALLPSVLNIELVEGDLITGVFSLPEGMTASQGLADANFSAFITSSDLEDNRLATSFTDNVRFQVGATQSAEFSVLVPPLENVRHEIRYNCDDFFQGDCEGLIRSALHTTAKPVFAEDSAEQFVTIPSPLNLKMVNGLPVNFSLRRPLSTPNIDELLGFGGLITSYEENGDLIDVQDLLRFIGSDSTEQSLEFRFLIPEDEGGRYDITFTCSEGLNPEPIGDCSFYELDHPSYSFSIDRDTIPDPIVLQMVEKFVPILPDSFEVDNTPLMANEIRSNVRQTHTIHEAGDIDWVSFTLEEPTDISLDAITGQTDDRAIVVLYDSAENEIAKSDDEFDADENNNDKLARISQTQLPAGSYLVSVEAMNTSVLVRSYSLRYTGPDDDFCVPIKTKAGATALICL